MVIPPILGEALLEIKDVIEVAATGSVGEAGSISLTALLLGFFAAFLSGCAACRWMISVVRRGKLIYFGIYCAIVGVLTICFL